MTTTTDYQHFRSAVDKSQRMMSLLSRLMPNVGGPQEAASDKRRAQRATIRRSHVGFPSAMASVHVYRTVLHEAAVIVARLPPVDLS